MRICTKKMQSDNRPLVHCFLRPPEELKLKRYALPPHTLISSLASAFLMMQSLRILLFLTLYWQERRAKEKDTKLQAQQQPTSADDEVSRSHSTRGNEHRTQSSVSRIPHAVGGQNLSSGANTRSSLSKSGSRGILALKERLMRRQDVDVSNTQPCNNRIHICPKGST